MKTRTTLATVMLSGQLLALGLGIAPAPAASGLTVEAQARAVVSQFFQTINARQFGKTCDLMSARFYRQNHIADRKHCVLGLTVGLGNSPTVFFRILGVRQKREETAVKVMANEAPGEIVLVEESGGLKVLRLDGS